MVEYGVAVTNKFHFLSDEEGANPDEILSKASQIKKEKGPIVKKPAAAPVETNVTKPERTFNKENEGNRNRGNNQRGRGNREGGDRRREGGEHRREGGEHRREGGDRPPRTFGDRERGERRGRGRGFAGGERRPRPQNNEGDVAVTEGVEERVEGERPFRGRGRGGFRRGGTRGDRVSGSEVTGVRHRDKRQGHGRGNWGTDQDEIKGETEPLNEVEGDKSTENVNPEVQPEQEKEEEKPSGITLAEWKKLQQQDDAKSFNVRKPNVDKKLVPVKRDEDEEEDKQEEYVYVQRESRHKHVDIPVNFSTGNARSFGNRDRGDRRGGRGGRGGDRSGGRSGRGQGFSLTQEAFPAL